MCHVTSRSLASEGISIRLLMCSSSSVSYSRRRLSVLDWSQAHPGARGERLPQPLASRNLLLAGQSLQIAAYREGSGMMGDRR